MSPTATTESSAPPGLPGAAEVWGRLSRENFTVASRLLPAGSRAHLLAFYGYARYVDQIGDDFDGDRLAALDWVGEQLDAALAGGPGRVVEPLVAAAAASVLALGGDASPLRDLLDANRRDQVQSSYDTWGELLDYCKLSAAPVGRLVLAAFEARSVERVALSDDVCAALQVVEHLQDVSEDRAAGRIYLPAEDRVRFGVSPDDLLASCACAHTGLRALVAFEAARARRLLGSGPALVAALTGRSKVAVAGFVAGGLATLDALGSARFDPIATAVRPAPTRVAWHTARLLAGAR